VKLGGVVDS